MADSVLIELGAAPSRACCDPASPRVVSFVPSEVYGLLQPSITHNYSREISDFVENSYLQVVGDTSIARTASSMGGLMQDIHPADE